ncbi:MAG: FtsQ-type POTRA domain-containing protein [Gemmatimonadota bacterium]|nr:FtsQ-type POTRA domain-containing protein [Gemmatimonadota bacterium]
MNPEKTKARKESPTVESRGRNKSHWPWIALSILATGSTLAAYQVTTYFGQASLFGLKAIEVDGLRRLNGEDVRVASGLAAGTNIFAIDLDEVVQRLEAVYWIKQAFVVRKPPDRVAIDIVEHRQVAWVDLGQTYGVAPDGVLLPVGSTARNLPVISGLSVTADSLRPGVAVPDSALMAILRWWEEAKVADAEFCLNVAGIQPMSGAGIRLQMAGDGLEVRLPANEADRRLRTIRELMPRVHQNHPDPAYIDLRYTGQMVVGKKKAKSG